MLKKITFLLLGLNLLTPKQVVAVEPVTVAACVIVSSIGSYFWGRSDGQAEVKAEIAKEDKRLKDEAKKAEALRKIEREKRLQILKADEDFQQCDKKNSDLGAAGVSKICKNFEIRLRLLQDPG